MQFVARGLPPGYVFENLRRIVKGGAFSSAELLAGCILSIAYILLASLIFQGTYRFVVRTGLMARYSAESVS